MSTSAAHVRTRPPSRIDGLGARAQAHPLAAFFAVTFGIAWVYELVVFGLLDLEFIPWSIPGTFAPAVAAVLVTRALEGRAGVRALWRRLLLWRVGARWYAFALVALPAVVVAGYAFFPDPKQNVDDPAYVVALAYLGNVLILSLMGGGQEEPGWRGFALPRMQERHGPLKASILLGLVWGVWHLPLFALVPDYDNADPGFLNVAAMFLAFTACMTVGLSVILTWLVNNAHGSVLLAVLAHGSANAATAFAPATALPLAGAFAAVAALGVLIAVATHGRLGYRGETVPERGAARPASAGRPRARGHGAARPSAPRARSR